MRPHTFLRWSPPGLTLTIILSLVLASGISCLQAKPIPALSQTNPELASWVRNYQHQTGTHPHQQKGLKWFETNKSKDGQSWVTKWPLHYAAMKGDAEGIKRLVSQGNDPNTEINDWYHSHPLGWAAYFGHLESVKTLILLGADPFVRNEAGFTPLEDAIRERQQPVVSFLMAYHKEAGCAIPGKTIEMHREMHQEDQPSIVDEIGAYLRRTGFFSLSPEDRAEIISQIIAYHKKTGYQIPEEALERLKGEGDQDELGNHDRIIPFLKKTEFTPLSPEKRAGFISRIGQDKYNRLKMELRRRDPLENARRLRALLAKSGKKAFEVLETELLQTWLRTASFGDEGTEVPSYLKPTEMSSAEVDKAWEMLSEAVYRFKWEIFKRGPQGCKEEIIQLYLWREHYRMTSNKSREHMLQFEINLYEEYLKQAKR